MTRKAFENAMVVVMALGGSTNAVLHLIAMARAVEVPLSIDDFQRVSNRVPYIADLKPSGRFVEEDLHAVGGTPAVMKYLLEKGLMDGDCMTVTGKTLGENLSELPGLKAGQKIVQTLDKPIKKTGHIQILRGNLAPEGAVAKITGKEGQKFTGPAKVYDGEEDMLHALERKEIAKGDVIVIRFEGPKGGPGMPEMLTPTSAIMGAGLGKDVGADNRRSLLGRIARLHRRPCYTRGPGWWPDRPAAQRRPHHARRREQRDHGRSRGKGTGRTARGLEGPGL